MSETWDQQKDERTHRRKNLKYREVKEAIRNTTSVYEACEKLKVGNATVYAAIKRFRLRKPRSWETNHLFRVGKLRRLNPTSIIESEADRMWVGLLVGTECGLQATYEKSFGSTELKISLGMTDREYVAKFAQLCKTGPPRHTAPRRLGRGDVWSKELKGLRALMVLKEVLPYLLDNKLRQARRAIEFFSPTGYRRGYHTSQDVWPIAEFPFRKGAKPNRPIRRKTQGIPLP